MRVWGVDGQQWGVDEGTGVRCEAYLISERDSTNLRFKFSVALRPQRPNTLRTIRDGGAQDVHLDFHTAPELCKLAD